MHELHEGFNGGDGLRLTVKILPILTVDFFLLGSLKGKFNRLTLFKTNG